MTLFDGACVPGDARLDRVLPGVLNSVGMGMMHDLGNYSVFRRCRARAW